MSVSYTHLDVYKRQQCISAVLQGRAPPSADIRDSSQGPLSLHLYAVFSGTDTKIFPRG